MKTTEIAVIGGGPAGLGAALMAAEAGAKVTLIDRQRTLGGQLIKQTHKFFGSKAQFAGTRGIEIASRMAERAAANPNIEVLLDTTALGYYGGNEILLQKGRHDVVALKADQVVVATGASERMLAFPGNDLPGVYGAGAIQTLMHIDGVLPGQRVLTVGSGNIGLIVTYQLLQAGVDVAAIVEAAPRIGGYLVHASKVRRLGVPILTRHSVKEVRGTDRVEEAVIWQLDSQWQGIPGTERTLAVDVIALAVGLSPCAELLWQAGCEIVDVPELGGFVPVCDERCETSVPGIFVGGDVASIEEASSALLEGELAGIFAAQSAGHFLKDGEAIIAKKRAELTALRAGPTGEKIRAGIAKLEDWREQQCLSKLG